MAELDVRTVDVQTTLDFTTGSEKRHIGDTSGVPTELGIGSSFRLRYPLTEETPRQLIELVGGDPANTTDLQVAKIAQNLMAVTAGDALIGNERTTVLFASLEAMDLAPTGPGELVTDFEVVDRGPTSVTLGYTQAQRGENVGHGKSILVLDNHPYQDEIVARPPRTADLTGYTKCGDPHVIFQNEVTNFGGLSGDRQPPHIDPSYSGETRYASLTGGDHTFVHGIFAGSRALLEAAKNADISGNVKSLSILFQSPVIEGVSEITTYGRQVEEGKVDFTVVDQSGVPKIKGKFTVGE